MWTGDRRNFISAADGVDLMLGGLGSGISAASQALDAHQQGHLYERALAAKAAADARYEELCQAWNILADRHERALDRVEQLERLLGLR
ncbi:hypothetical protein [Roseateles sp.]|uniref:hypothetical protein n=1 Tax=Roseateles sp. TaxID=1971397 RepID=UPI003BA8AA8C